jgi:hypothetical protein
MFQKFFSLIFFCSCISNHILAQDSEAAMRNNFAQALVRSMSDPAVRTFIRNEVSGKVDGEDVAMYAFMKDKLVGRETFSQILQRNANPGLPNNYFSSVVTTSDELLAITVPINFSIWNPATFTPNVVVELNDSETDQALTVYDPSGNTSILSGTETPNVPVIVLQSSDRMIAVNPGTRISPDGFKLDEITPFVGVTKIGTTNLTNGLDYYRVLYEATDRGSDPETRGPAGGCERDNKTTKDECTRFRLTFGGYNHAGGHTPLRPWWIEGLFLEMQLRIFFADAGLNSQGLTHIYKYKDIPNSPLVTASWTNFNVEVFHWVKDTNGDKMLYRWDEYDDGRKREIKVSLGTKVKGVDLKLEGTFDLTNRSDAMGDSIIEYCDAANTPGTEYNTGRVRFFVRHKD